ncbi:MAG: FkbM family methyltransferase [Syntrophales bacterium LBB04]|nr:FkbM family methyltransferase [Syntrophales bacterium LBB04]
MSDREKICLIKKVIEPGMTVLDIGANIGFYSTLFARLVGEKGNVIAFEPDALNFKHLSANTRKFANVTAHQLACGDKTQELKLYLSDKFNVDHQTFDSGEGRKCVETQSVSIDDYLNNNRKVDFIKIDVQGYDFYAIKGAIETIKNSPSLIILGELWPYALNKAGVRPSEYLKLLESLGLSVQVPDINKHENFDERVHDRYFYIDFYARKKV